MDFRTIAKMMAVLFFISSGVNAFLLYHFTRMFETGKLPYGIEALAKPTEDTGEELEADKVAKEVAKEVKSKSGKPGEGYMNRINERMVNELYQRLREKEAKISEEREKVAEQKKIAEEIEAQATKTQKELEKYREKIKDLLDVVDKKEIDNLKKIVTMLQGLELEQAVAMFRTYDKNKAARILYYMNPKVAKDMMANILETATDELVKDELRDITERMHRLTEELEDE